MSNVEDIEKAIEGLTPGEFARFRAWFDHFDAARLDEKIERNAREGKLDALANDALASHQAGRSREL
jgi:hypothetical protein